MGCFIIAILVILSSSAPAQGYGCECGEKIRLLYLSTPPMEGNDVKMLQEQLSELGFYKGRQDGVFGPETHDAVMELQGKTNVGQTGEVDLETWEALTVRAASRGESKEAPPGKISILIDINQRTLTIMSDGEPYQTYPCAVGKSKTPTPVGEWVINHKGGNWGNGFGTRWMGIDVPWGIFGIHGTNKPYTIGTFASAGCIRMFNVHVERIYEWVQKGTPVTIVGEPLMPPTKRYRKNMGHEAVGPDVVQVQLHLKEKGFLLGRADGVYGSKTQLSVKFFQAKNNIDDTGIVDELTYDMLGLDLTKK